MAKTSAIQKNLKRIKLVKKYSKKRAALKKIINNRIRIHNFQKFAVIARSYIKYQLNLIQFDLEYML